MADLVVVPVEPGFTEVFRSYNGPVGRDLLRRGRLVQAAARRQADDHTGRLDHSIRVTRFTRAGGDQSVRVGSDLSYAYMHHQGTEPHIIRPKNAKVVRWVDDAGIVHFAPVVHHPGTKPNRYLADNLPLAVR